MATLLLFVLLLFVVVFFFSLLLLLVLFLLLLVILRLVCLLLVLVFFFVLVLVVVVLIIHTSDLRSTLELNIGTMNSVNEIQTFCSNVLNLTLNNILNKIFRICFLFSCKMWCERNN